MPRPPREFIDGAYYHLYARGSNRQAISIVDADRADFVACLEHALTQNDLQCVAYCLMPNHYHLVLSARDGGVSRAIQQLNGRYALRFNRRYSRDAHVFKNRFGASLLATESHFLTACAYVVANPVRALLCASPGEWPWSSYRASVGLDPAPEFLDLSALLSSFADESDAAMSRFREFVLARALYSATVAVSDTEALV